MICGVSGDLEASRECLAEFGLPSIFGPLRVGDPHSPLLGSMFFPEEMSYLEGSNEWLRDEFTKIWIVDSSRVFVPVFRTALGMWLGWKRRPRDCKRRSAVDLITE